MTTQKKFASSAERRAAYTRGLETHRNKLEQQLAKVVSEKRDLEQQLEAERNRHDATDQRRADLEREKLELRDDLRRAEIDLAEAEIKLNAVADMFDNWLQPIGRLPADPRRIAEDRAYVRSHQREFSKRLDQQQREQ